MIFTPSQQFVVTTFVFYLNDDILLNINHNQSTQYTNNFQSLVDILKIDDNNFIVSTNSQFCSNMTVNNISANRR